MNGRIKTAGCVYTPRTHTHSGIFFSLKEGNLSKWFNVDEPEDIMLREIS